MDQLISKILSEAVECPREDVIHDSAVKLADQVMVYGETLSDLCFTLYANPNPIKRTVAAKALGYCDGHFDRIYTALKTGLLDSNVEVRGAVVSAFCSLGDDRAISWIASCLKIESSPLVREAMEDAIAELAARF